MINENMCFGGAKCRDVCPWGVPARQAGVGLYLKMAPQFAGGGVMYKCDMCYDKIKAAEAPSCAAACPQKAIIFGDKESMRAEALKRARAIDGYVYGERENGGTSTFYVSAVPFEALHKALLEQSVDGKPGRAGMPVAVDNFIDTPNGLAASVFIAPVAGLIAAGVAAYRTMQGKE